MIERKLRTDEYVNGCCPRSINHEVEYTSYMYVS